jgi:hypothetical protein
MRFMVLSALSLFLLPSCFHISAQDEPFALNSPQGLIADKADNIFVSDTGTTGF